MQHGRHQTSANDTVTVLGLNFGHDASATVVEGGRILANVSRERLIRRKHVLGLDMQVIDGALRAARRRPSDIDAVAVTSTQGVELISGDPHRFTVRYSGRDRFGRPYCQRFAGLGHEAIAAMGTRTVQDLRDPVARSTPWGQVYGQLALAEDVARASSAAVPWIDTYTIHPPWAEPRSLAQLAEVAAEATDDLRYGFHVPVAITLDDHQIDGYAIHHHLAHAAASYYLSGFSSAAVFTHDGYDLNNPTGSHGMEYDAGMFYLGAEQALYPIWPHGLTVGHLYDSVGFNLGLSVVGSSGKLMGLAAYGTPTEVSEAFVDTAAVLSARFEDVERDWFEHCRRAARSAGDRPSNHDRPSVDPQAAVVAATTQALFEKLRRRATHTMTKMFASHGWETRRLCMSGGTALNCPSNSDIAASPDFDEVFVEPACDDGGIAVGAALAVTHSILDQPLRPRGTVNRSPYLGPSYGTDDIEAALKQCRLSVTSTRPHDPARAAAEDLVADRLVAWFEGRSEIGPRALGHRSILADPRHLENWARVNVAKRREAWRPFAPAVLVEHVQRWFTDAPRESPYMLFNAHVSSAEVLAVTHVDGTARVQTVDESCGEFHRVLRHFHEMTEVPVVLNTSFNGPGEPIVETPLDAIKCFVASGIDVLYLDGLRVEAVMDNPPSSV